MLDVVKLFQSRDTRDELGTGTIRDAFSEHFSQALARFRLVHAIFSLFHGYTNKLRKSNKDNIGLLKKLDST